MTRVNSLEHVLFPFARWEHDHAQTPLPCETSMTRAWAVATAHRPWAGLTVCVYMDVHASGSRSLPRAATLSSTYWWCLQTMPADNACDNWQCIIRVVHEKVFWAIVEVEVFRRNRNLSSKTTVENCHSSLFKERQNHRQLTMTTVVRTS